VDPVHINEQTENIDYETVVGCLSSGEYDSAAIVMGGRLVCWDYDGGEVVLLRPIVSVMTSKYTFKKLGISNS